MRSVKDNSSRRQDQDDTRLVAVKTQTIGLERLGGKHDDVGLIHLMTIHYAPGIYERMDPLVVAIGKPVR